jgi:hypothetical protein
LFTGICNSSICWFCGGISQSPGGGALTLELPVNQRVSNYTLKLTIASAVSSVSVRILYVFTYIFDAVVS